MIITLTPNENSLKKIKFFPLYNFHNFYKTRNTIIFKTFYLIQIKITLYITNQNIIGDKI